MSLAADGLVQSAHDCAEGGLAVTLAECSFDTGGIGADVDVPAVDDVPGGLTVDATLFSESASRVVISTTGGEARAGAGPRERAQRAGRA